MTDPLVRRLEERQAELAKAALSAPQDRSEFEYGRVSGIYAGLEMAKEMILGLQAEKDKRQNEL